MKDNERDLSWSPSLTQKERYFLMIKPLLDLNKSMFKSDELSYLGDHYDIFSIGLKIIEIIIENTTVLNISNITGITRARIIDKMRPILDYIDYKKGKVINDEQRTILINRIIDNLISTGREMHQMEFIDYSTKDSNFKWQSHPFQLLYLDTTPDDEVQVMVSMELVNIYTNILDTKIEDQHNAILYTLDQQIQRGDLEGAVKTAEHNLNLTLVFVKMMQDIIFKTKRKYQTLDWIMFYPKKLEEAKSHIAQCITKQRRQQDELLRKFSELITAVDDAYYWIKELEQKMKKSFEMLLPLQNMIDDARKTFDERSSQVFEFLKPIAFQLESDFFPKLLELPAYGADEFIETTKQFFTKCDFPRLINLNGIVNLLMLHDSRELKREIFSKNIDRKIRTKIPRSKSPDGEQELYSQKLRKRVIDELSHILGTLSQQETILLSRLLDIFREKGFNNFERNYLRLLLQGRFACESFEGRYLREKIIVDLAKNYFKNEDFEGRDLLIHTLNE